MAGGLYALLLRSARTWSAWRSPANQGLVVRSAALPPSPSPGQCGRAGDAAAPLGLRLGTRHVRGGGARAGSDGTKMTCAALHFFERRSAALQNLERRGEARRAPPGGEALLL